MVSIQGLTSLVPTLGGKSYSQWLTENFPLADRWDHQDLSGSSVLEASYSTALATGRELVINGDFANWTGVAPNDSPDSWDVTQAGDATSNVTENPAGECQLICDGTNVVIRETILQFGATYTVTINVTAAVAGALKVNLGDGNQIGLITTTGLKTFSGTAIGPNARLSIGRNFSGESTDITISEVTCEQTGILASSAYPGSELIADGDMEAATTAAWSTNNAIIAKDTGTVFAGLQSLKVTRDGAQDTAYQAITSVLGKNIYASVWGFNPTAGSGIDIRLRIGTAPGLADIADIVDTTKDTWVQLDELFVATVDTVYIQVGINGSAAEFAFFDNMTTKVQNPMNGTTVVAQVGVPTNFGSLGLSVVDPGTASFSNFHSAEVNSKLNITPTSAAGFINIWAKVRAASVWTDGITRLIVSIVSDASNSLTLRKRSSNNEVLFKYVAGGVSEDIIVGLSTLDTFMMTMTWDSTGNLIAYINGVQVGTPQAIAGTWVGNLDSTQTVIGAANTTPVNVWDGSRTRFMLGYEAITPAQVLSLYNQGRR